MAGSLLVRRSGFAPIAHARPDRGNNLDVVTMDGFLSGYTDDSRDRLPLAGDELATDHPDVTNSSLVVPFGSFQSENGSNFTAQSTPCVELLLYLPTHVAAAAGAGLLLE